MPSQTESRKDNHIEISLKDDVQPKEAQTGFSDVHLVHQALPEINRDEILLSKKILGHQFSAPILVGAMTGGTKKGAVINAHIAEAIDELGLGMGVGSQRAALEKPELKATFGIAREKAPNAFLVANIGGPQLAQDMGLKHVTEAIEMIEASALAIHLNPLQEAIQPEGEAKYSGVLSKIEKIIDKVDVPVIIKETGAGISAEVAEKLEKIGVKGIDISGVGGTSWAAVEFHRAKLAKDMIREKLGKSFWDWGIPTVVSLVEVCQSTQLTVISSGGVRTGTDVAKSIGLGASLASMSNPILKPATRSVEAVKKALESIIEELINAMFLVGARNLSELRNVPLILLGRTAEWLEKRGFNPERYARR